VSRRIDPAKVAARQAAHHARQATSRHAGPADAAPQLLVTVRALDAAAGPATLSVVLRETFNGQAGRRVGKAYVTPYLWSAVLLPAFEAQGARIASETPAAPAASRPADASAWGYTP
jgi:hypothetical protein